MVLPKFLRKKLEPYAIVANIVNKSIQLYFLYTIFINF